MNDWLISILIFVVGIINFTPLIGIVSGERLSALYGIEIDEPNLEILMRHRALLFGLVGGLILCSLLRPDLQSVALIVGLVSMVGFVMLDWMIGERNAKLKRIVMIDIVASVLAAVALGFVW